MNVAIPIPHHHRRSASGRETRRTWPTWREWPLFCLHVMTVVLVEVGNDVLRGNVWRPDPVRGVRNARAIASFESRHGFFVEPNLQIFFRHTHHLLGLSITWNGVVVFANNVYAFCHIGVTLGVALWIYVDHRPRFLFFRNVMFLTNALALVGYEAYPMAPPRLTTGLLYNHHLFHFQDTMRHVLGTGTLNGTPIGYNPFSAMPSLHVAWAFIVGAAVLLLARHPALRIGAVLYPAVMIFTVVITANHYLMDAVGAAVAAGGATALALVLEHRLPSVSHRGARPGRARGWSSAASNQESGA